MSAKKKWQHFVPRHYLKRFSFDGGRRIRLVRVHDGYYVSDAALAGQCAKNYFYSRDPKVEDHLAEIEGHSEAQIQKICEDEWMPTTSPDRMTLFSFLCIMRGRTELAAAQAWVGPEALLKEQFRAYLEREEKHELLKVLPAFRLEDDNAPLRTLAAWLSFPVLLADLSLKLLIAPEGVQFITSDNPVVVLNQAFWGKVKHRSLGGVAMRGAQFFVPLSPRHTLIAYDTKCYRVGKPDKLSLKLNRKEDVMLINALQIRNANHCLYFKDEENRGSVAKLLSEHRGRRQSVQDLIKINETIEDGEKVLTFHNQAPSIPVPGKWSFCRVRRQFHPSEFSHRDPGLCRLFEKYQQDCSRREKYIPLHEWCDEKEFLAVNGGVLG
jgi:hypothetical protein